MNNPYQPPNTISELEGHESVSQAYRLAYRLLSVLFVLATAIVGILSWRFYGTPLLGFIAMLPLSVPLNWMGKRLK